MSTNLLIQLLFGSLAVVMAGLGLSLEVADFRRLWFEKKAAATGIFIQVLLLPTVAFAIAVGMRLTPPFALGLMLLAASPGSISSNLYSYLFGGNVALNVSLTGINTLLSTFTLPLITGLAFAYFAVPGAVAIPPGKIMEAVAMILVPVALGMLVRHRAPSWAERLGKPIKVASAVLLLVLATAAIVNEWTALTQRLPQLGISVLMFNMASLGLGFWVSRAMRLDTPTTLAITFQVCIHSAVLAIYVALTVLKDPLIATPAALYSVTMTLTGLSFGVLYRRRARRRQATLASGALMR